MLSRRFAISCLSLLLLLQPTPLLAAETSWQDDNSAGMSAYQRGDYKQASQFFESAVEKAKTTKAEPKDYATTINNLALLYYSQGRYADAESLYKDALAILKKALGDYHPYTAGSINNLAELYESQGRYADAEPLLKDALAIRRKILGNDHPDTAQSINNVASLYHSMGRYADAEPLYKDALAICKKALGNDHPDTAASINNLAGLYERQGRYTDAEPLYKEALAIRRKALGNDHPDTAQSINNLALLYDKQGRYADAEPLYKDALAIRRKALGNEHPDTATSINNLAGLYLEQGRYADSESLFKEALAIRRKALGNDHPSTATSINNLAGLYQYQGRYADAEPLYEEALIIYRKTLGNEHTDTARAINNLAFLYQSRGRYADAESLYKNAIAVKSKALGDHHPSTALSINNLAVLYKSQGRYADAEPLYKDALAIFRATLGNDHPDTAGAIHSLADLYHTQGRYPDAEPLSKEALAINRKTLGNDHPSTSAAINDLARLYQSQGRYAAAEPLYKDALAICRKALGNDHPSTATSINNLAALYKSQGRYADAEPLYEEALAIARKTLGKDHPDTAQSINSLALLYKSQGRYADAEPLLKDALAIRRKGLGNNHSSTATSINNLAALYDSQGRYADAEPLYKEALTIERKALGKDHPSTATSINNLAVLYQSQGRYADAEPLLKDALAIRRKALGNDHPSTATSINNLAGLYESQGRYADAEPLYKDALAIRRKAQGNDHPDTAGAIYNLALLYHRQERYADAEPLYKEALAIRRKALGIAHPETAASINNLAALYATQGRYADAEPLLRDALAIYRKALGNDHPSTATSINNLANLYQSQGRYADAEPLFREGQSIRIRNFGKPMLSETQFVDLALKELRRIQGAFLQENEAPSADLYNFVRRLKGCQKFPKLDFASLSSQTRQQIATIELALFQKSVDTPEFNIVSSLLSIEALQQSSTSAPALGKALADLLIANRLEALDGESKNLVEETAKSLESLAMKSLESKTLGESSIFSSAKATHEALCRMLLCNAFLLAENGNKERAIEQADLASKVIEADSSNRVLDSATIAELHIDSATFFKLIGNFGQARVHLDDANAIISELEASLDRHDSFKSLTKANIANLQARVLLALCELAFEQEDYQTTLDLGSKTLSLAALMDPKLLHDRIRLLLSLSQSAVSIGNKEEGLDFAKQAATLAKSDVDKDADTLVAAEIAYARALASDGRTGDSISHLQQCLASISGSSNSNSTSVQAASQSDAIDSSKLSVNRELIAELYSALAECQREEKKYEEARLSFSRALDITRKNMARSAVSSEIDEIFGIAQCDACSHDSSSASSLAYQAANFLNNYINDVFPNLSFAEQRSFIHKVKDYSSILLALCHEKDQMPTTYWYLMRWRGLLVEGLRRQSLLGSKANDPKLAPIYSQWLAAKGDIARISSAALNDKQIRSHLQELTKTKESLERRLLGSNNVVDPLTKLSISDFINRVGEDEALVELYTYEPVVQKEKEEEHKALKQLPMANIDRVRKERELHHGAIVVTRSGISFVDIPEAQVISNAISDWRDIGLSSATRGDRDVKLPGNTIKRIKAEAIEKADGAWQTLESKLWKPILKALPTNCSKLFICDDEDLSRIPWSKLVDDGSDGRSFLVARVDSPREFAVLKNSTISTTDGASIATKSTTAGSASDTSNSEFLLVGDIHYRDHRLKLVGTADEIAAIKKLVEETSGASSSHLNLTPLTGKEPTRAKVLKHLPKAKIAHLATHGFFTQSEPRQAGTRGRSRALVRSTSTVIGSLAAARNPLVSSGVLLASEDSSPRTAQQSSSSVLDDATKAESNGKSPNTIRLSSGSISTESGDVYIEDEGKLTAEELVDLDLRNCDLIVLSACDTGRGTEERGQGVIGLRSAIMSAGARTLILSLWPVDDDATRLLMTEFYRQVLVNGKPKAEALKLAKEAVRTDREHPKWKHPYFWAAWALVGEGW